MDWKNRKTFFSQAKVREFKTDWKKSGDFTQNTRKVKAFLPIFIFTFSLTF